MILEIVGHTNIEEMEGKFKLKVGGLGLMKLKIGVEIVLEWINWFVLTVTTWRWLIGFYACELRRFYESLQVETNPCSDTNKKATKNYRSGGCFEALCCNAKGVLSL